MKKIIALDIDGTLTNSKKEVTQPTLDKIIEIQKKGHVVAIASGRPLPGIRKIAGTLPGPSGSSGSARFAPGASPLAGRRGRGAGQPLDARCLLLGRCFPALRTARIRKVLFPILRLLWGQRPGGIPQPSLPSETGIGRLPQKRASSGRKGSCSYEQRGGSLSGLG